MHEEALFKLLATTLLQDRIFTHFGKKENLHELFQLGTLTNKNMQHNYLHIFKINENIKDWNTISTTSNIKWLFCPLVKSLDWYVVTWFDLKECTSCSYCARRDQLSASINKQNEIISVNATSKNELAIDFLCKKEKVSLILWNKSKSISILYFT